MIHITRMKRCQLNTSNPRTPHLNPTNTKTQPNLTPHFNPTNTKHPSVRAGTRRNRRAKDTSCVVCMWLVRLFLVGLSLSCWFVSVSRRHAQKEARKRHAFTRYIYIYICWFVSVSRRHAQKEARERHIFTRVGLSLFGARRKRHKRETNQPVLK